MRTHEDSWKDWDFTSIPMMKYASFSSMNWKIIISCMAGIIG